MKATALEFRLRFLIHVVIFVLGLTTPWDYALHLDTIRTWQWLAANISRTIVLSFSAATLTILVLGILLALVAALLRTWASACLGASIVQDSAMHAGHVVAAGPYRYLRNPLYLGTFLHTLALSLLMPPSGAVFTIVLIGIFQIRLILAEESFLTASLGAPYLAYLAQVPRLFPALRPRVVASTIQPRWLPAFLTEIYFWGVFLAFAIAGWRYNAQLILQGVLVSFGLSLIARAFKTSEPQPGTASNS
jgi:protein-S-isoprenylcysteine O-methyltransferase Ste14